MQLFAFALSRLPDPYAILLGSTIGMIFRQWWQAVLAGVAGGTAMALVFGYFGGLSSDAPAYFAVDAVVVVLWSSLAFAVREVLRRRKLLQGSGPSNILVPAFRADIKRFGRRARKVNNRRDDPSD